MAYQPTYLDPSADRPLGGVSFYQIVQDAMAAKRQREHDAAQMLLGRQRLAREAAAEDRRAALDEAKANHLMQIDERARRGQIVGQMPELRKLAATGQTDAVESQLAALGLPYQREDVPQEPPPVAPIAPEPPEMGEGPLQLPAYVAPEAPGFVGPIDTPEHAKSAEIQRIATLGQAGDQDALNMSQEDMQRSANAAATAAQVQQQDRDKYAEANRQIQIDIGSEPRRDAKGRKTFTPPKIVSIPARQMEAYAFERKAQQEGLENFDAQQAAYGDAKADYDAKMAARAEQQQPRFAYNVEMPGGGSTRIDPLQLQQQQQAKWATDAQMFAQRWQNVQHIGGEENDLTAKYVDSLKGEIASGLDPKKAGERLDRFMMMDLKGKQQTALAHEKMQNQRAMQQERLAVQAQLQAQRMAHADATAAAKKAAGGGVPPSEMRPYTEFRQAVNQFLTQNEYKAENSKLKGLLGSLVGIKSNNSMLQHGAGYGMVFDMQGSHVITDKDMELIDANPGIAGKLKNWLQEARNGQYDKEKQKIVIDAVEARLQEKARQHEETRKRFRNNFGPDSKFAEWLGKDFVEKAERTWFGGEGESLGGQGSPMAQAGQSPKKPVTALEAGAKIKAAQDWLKSADAQRPENEAKRKAVENKLRAIQGGQ